MLRADPAHLAARSTTDRVARRAYRTLNVRACSPDAGSGRLRRASAYSFLRSIDCILLSGIHSRASAGCASAEEAGLERIPDEQLDRIEREHEAGISSSEILDVFVSHGIKFSEASLRKYVQLGLLPRSVRVGRKGKHQGSQGMYPVQVVRQIQRIKEMMAQDYTIEEIQREFLFVRGDIEELERTLAKVFSALKDAAQQRRSEMSGRAITNDLSHAESIARELLAKLAMIEQRLTAQARLSRSAAAS
jgi:hypothetical protein